MIRKSGNFNFRFFFFNFMVMSRLILWMMVTIAVLWQSHTAQGQCITMRYQDSIFHSVDTTSGIYFATANPFGLSSSQDLYLDLYRPHGDTVKQRPLIVFQHGGSFLNGSRTQTIIPAYATYFAKCGYVVASIDYRLGFDPLSTGSAERAVYRAMQDLRASVRFLCQNAQLYGIDTNSVILTGNSAGCISDLCSAFMTESQFPSAIHGTLTESSDLGPIDSSGNNDFGDRYVKPIAVISHWGAILDTSFITTSDSIPVLCIQGTADPVVPYISGHPYGYPVFPVVEGSLPISIRLTDLGVRNKLIPLPGMGHEPEQSDPSINDTMNNEGREFLWRVLKPLSHPVSGPDTICRLHLATYSVAATPGVHYCWQLNGAGNIVADSGNAITVLWNDSNNVSVSVVETNYMGAQADAMSYQTWVIPPVKAAFDFHVNMQEVTFANTSTLATGAMWYFGNGDSSSQMNPVEHFGGGTYSVTLVSLNGECGDTNAVTHTFFIDSCPVAHFTYALNGLDAFFYADTTDTQLYSWNFGDGAVANVSAAHVLHIYQHYSNYRVSLAVKNNEGCTGSDTLTVSLTGTAVNDVPDAEVKVNCDLTHGCFIRTGGNKIWTVEVYDLLGRKFISVKILGDDLLETTALPAGVYLLKVSNGVQSVAQKFIKQ